jgi:hypothetical protein
MELALGIVVLPVLFLIGAVIWVFVVLFVKVQKRRPDAK